MKNILGSAVFLFGLAMLFVVAAPTTAVEAITVISPESGTLPYGHLAWLSWEGGDSYDEVTLELYRQGGGVVVNTGSDVTWNIGTVANTGTRTWTVSSDLKPADDYLLRVAAVGNSSVFDVSNATFGIAEDVDDDPPVIVTYPAGGELFTVGDTITITWTGMPAAYTSYIWMQQDGAGVKTGSVSGNSGSYSWTFDADRTGTDFTFSVASNVDFDNIDYSGVFSIQPVGGINEPDAPEFDVELSQPDELGDRMLTFTITKPSPGALGYRLYESTGLGFIGNIKMQVSADTTEFTLHTLDHNLPRGNYAYYILRAYNEEEESSNADRTHVYIPPVGFSYQIISPNGGEEYKPGETITLGIELEGYGEDDIFLMDLSKGNVCVDASYNGERDCGLIVEILDVLDSVAPPLAGTPVGTKTYSWTIPEDIESGDDYRISLVIALSPLPLAEIPFDMLIDQSDTPFSIRAHPFAEGELLRASNDPRIFVYKSGVLHHLPDIATIAARRLIDKTITIVDPSVIADIPLGFAFMPEGALIRAQGSPDIYIVKYAGEKQFVRLILNPTVFESYGHLRWEDVRDVSPAVVAAFPEATLVRVAGTNQVYRLTPNGDIGVRQRISDVKISQLGLDVESVYEINSTDHASYTEGVALD